MIICEWHVSVVCINAVAVFFVYLWLLLWYISVACISGGSGPKKFRERLEKLMLLLQKLLMSCINRVRKLRIFYFSRKIKKFKI